MSDTVNCPYCEEEQTINHDDGYGYEEDVLHEQECVDCGKTFIFTTSIIYCYGAHKADCLNGGKHEYQETNVHPRRFTKLVCTMCGDEKDVSQERMEEFKKKGEY